MNFAVFCINAGQMGFYPSPTHLLKMILFLNDRISHLEQMLNVIEPRRRKDKLRLRSATTRVLVINKFRFSQSLDLRAVLIMM